MFNPQTQPRTRQRYNIEPMVSNTSVQWALLHRQYASDPEYVKAVIRSYIEVKKARGRLTNDISIKLNYLEQELPQYADSFHAVRTEYRLPPSRVLRPSSSSLGETLTAVSSRHSLAPSTSRTSIYTPPRVARRATETTRRPATTSHAPQPLPEEFRVRPDAANEDELPPPPYTRADPEPDSTRMLQERLAAEAEAAETIPPEPPSSTRPSASSPRPTPALVWPDTPNRRASLHQQPSWRSSQPAQPERPVSPPHPPEDDEIARAYEENQLEEAKRASIIAERERQEVAEAMRLSLADEEQQQLANAQAGPSRPAISSLMDEEDGLQRRMSSYSPVRLSNPEFPPAHRRVLSGYSPSPPVDLSGSHTAQSQLSVPGGPSLLDWDEADGTSQQAPLVPQKTGAVIQSRNPFFSSDDAALPKSPGYTESQMGPAIERKASSSSDREQAGSSRTAFVSGSGRALPAIPKGVTAQSDGGSALGPGLEPALDVSEPAEAVASASQDTADPLHTLTYYQTVFLIDDSPSIAGEGWERAQRAFIQVTETAMRYSVEGIDVYFTNSKRVGRELGTADDVEELLAGLQPRGNESIGHRLRAILRDYLERLSVPDVASPGKERREVKPMNLIIITDGACAEAVIQRKHRANEPSLARTEIVDQAPEDDLERVIVMCARELDRAGYPESQIGVQFLQIGGSLEAREALAELDDGIASVHAIRDMVDLVVHDEAEMPAERIQKTVFGGIDRSWDDYTA